MNTLIFSCCHCKTGPCVRICMQGTWKKISDFQCSLLFLADIGDELALILVGFFNRLLRQGPN